jgi:hypothetical protein
MNGLPLISHRMFVAALEPASGRPAGNVSTDSPREVESGQEPPPAVENVRSSRGSKPRGLATLSRPVLAAGNGVIEA